MNRCEPGNIRAIEDRPGRPGIVPIEKGMAAAVRQRRPQPEGGSVVAVDVLPPVVENSPVRHDVGTGFKEVIPPDLTDIRPVGGHPVEVALDVLFAAAVFRIPRAGEDDISTRKIAGIDIGRDRIGREPGQAGPVGVHLADVVFVERVPAEGEEDFGAVKGNVQVTRDAIGPSPAASLRGRCRRNRSS